MLPDRLQPRRTGREPAAREDAREAGGLLHTFRVGDLGCTTKGAPFQVEADALADTNRRAAAGVLDAFTTAPLPGTSRLKPSAEVDAEERDVLAVAGDRADRIMVLWITL